MFSLPPFITLIRKVRPWQDGQWQYLRQQITRYDSRAAPSPHSNLDHLRSAALWLAEAQDATITAFQKGGVAGRYLLGQGWTDAYPKTTGDLIPTFLALDKLFPDDGFEDRAKACVNFLRPLQMSDGAYPAGEITSGPQTPSSFNTAQILCGLMAWHRHTGDEVSLGSALRAGDWLVAAQSRDGPWRQHFIGGIPSTHDAYIGCWLAELGEMTGDSRYFNAARRNLNWVLGKQDKTTGWIDLAGYDRAQQKKREALTHSIAYTLMGMLRSALILEDEKAIAAVRQAALGVARLLERKGWLPAVLDWQWQPQTAHACLTGNAQMAELWLTLHQLAPDKHLFDAAVVALDIVKRSQSLDNPDPGIRGGISGSNPVWGEYIFMALPNWAAKFFVDALMLLEVQNKAQAQMFRDRNGIQRY
jgi:hypothetical protein